MLNFFQELRSLSKNDFFFSIVCKIVTFVKEGCEKIAPSFLWSCAYDSYYIIFFTLFYLIHIWAILYKLFLHFSKVFVRELISNASDALEKLRYFQLTTGDSLDKPHEIHIATDKQARTFVIQVIFVIILYNWKWSFDVQLLCSFRIYWVNI